MAEGWIKLHRQIIDSEWFTDVNTNHLFTYCLIRANHKAAKWQGVDIERGQFITSLDSLSSGTGLSVGQIRTSLKKLITTSNLTSKSTNKYRLITVANYDEYQSEDKLPDSQAASKRQSNSRRVATDKNNNNNKNENKPLTPKGELDMDFLKYKRICFDLKGSAYVNSKELMWKACYEKDNPDKKIAS